MPIIFAAISPHPPIILPTVGSPQDRAQVKNTILALEKLGKALSKKAPAKIIISAPHPDWGFNVPLFFLDPQSLEDRQPGRVQPAASGAGTAAR